MQFSAVSRSKSLFRITLKTGDSISFSTMSFKQLPFSTLVVQRRGQMHLYRITWSAQSPEAAEKCTAEMSSYLSPVCE